MSHQRKADKENSEGVTVKQKHDTTFGQVLEPQILKPQKNMTSMCKCSRINYTCPTIPTRIG